MATANRLIPLRLLHALGPRPQPDGELLGRYLAAGDEDAFAEIVRRNGPLVLRACRHVLGETTAAEDAFQATFLLLARKGRSLPLAGSLAGWLHAAAVRIAADARRAEGRRRRRESAAEERDSVSSPPEELMWREVRERLDTELAALPEKYRVPLVLCYLQELGYDEAARRAGCSPGALRGRLERGKKILRKRLARYGLPLVAPVLVLGQPAAVPAALCEATVATVKSGLTRGAVPTAVAALAGPTIPLTAKIMALAGVILAAFGLAWALQGETSPRAAAQAPPKPPPEAKPGAPPQRGVDTRGDALPPGAVARFGTRRFQISTQRFGPVSALGGRAYLVYQPGKWMARAEFRWLDPATGKVLDVWPGPLGEMINAETGKPTGSSPPQTPVALSPDGRWAVFTDPRAIFTGLRAGPVTLERSFRFSVYDLTARKKAQDLRGKFEEGETPPSHACISPDGKWLASTGRTVRFWDVATGKQVWAHKDSGHVFAVLGFSQDGKRLILRRSSDAALVVVDTLRGRVLRTIETKLFGRGRGTLLSPDGATVLMGVAAPRGVTVWNVPSGKELPPLAEDPDARFTAWAFSPDGSTLVCALQLDRARLVVRSWPSRKVRRKIDLGRSGVSSLFISGDNRTVNILFESEQTLHRYDLESGKPLPVPAETHRAPVVGVEVAPDGSILSLGLDRVWRTWDLASGRQTRQVPLDFTPAQEQFALRRDGKLVAAANASLSTVTVLDRRGKVVRRIDTSGQGIDHAVFSPSGRLLAGSGRGVSAVQVWETATGKPLVRLAAGKGVWWSRTVGVAFSPDERYLVATAPGTVRFWEVNGWRQVGDFPENASGLAFSPDGRMLACGSTPETAVWEVASRRLRLKLGTPDYYTGVQRFSPDGRLLARLIGVSDANTVEVWDVLRNRQVAAFPGHDGPIRAFAFTRDGRHLLTASDDCTLLAWDLAGAVASARAGQKPSAPTDRDLADSWQALASPDAAKAFTALRTLVDAPERATDLVRTSLKAPAPLDAKKVQRLLTDLGSETFAVRTRASEGLTALGEMVELPLRRFLAGSPSLEAKRRAEQILGVVTRLPASPERLRQLRAVEVLEHIGTEGAREDLRHLAKGPPEAPLTRDATATLGRMATSR
jgi:RNA polymerase sigma factor (sigma-70 family)